MAKIGEGADRLVCTILTALIENFLELNGDFAALMHG
jgi:hypothetical protein